MQTQSGYLQVGKEKLHYVKSGNGNQLLLAFHGYGENADSLQLVIDKLSHQYTTYSFDLPHHGQSTWADNFFLHPQHLMAAIKQLITDNGSEKTALLGYSMGGRVCLKIFEQLPLSISKITLLATDGLTTDKYYYLFTQTSLGKTMFNHMLTQPNSYFKLIGLLRSWKWLDESRYKFVMHYLGNAEKRKQLRLIWPAMSKLMPDSRLVKKLIEQQNLPVHIIMGKYDRVMPPKLAEAFKVGLKTVHLHIVEKGHKILGQDTAVFIAQTLL